MRTSQGFAAAMTVSRSRAIRALVVLVAGIAAVVFVNYALLGSAVGGAESIGILSPSSALVAGAETPERSGTPPAGHRSAGAGTGTDTSSSAASRKRFAPSPRLAGPRHDRSGDSADRGRLADD